MNNVIMQEAEFKAGEYGELVVTGQPVLESVFFDFYPKGVYGEPKEAGHKEASIPMATIPSPIMSSGGGSDASVNLGGPQQSEEPEPEGLTEAFAEPRMVLYYSNSPRDGWKRIGEFKAHIYADTVRKARFYRLIHPKGCPFEGKVVAVGKII